MVVESWNIGYNDVVGSKMFKKNNFGENTKKTIIIIALLMMNLASDHLNKDIILFLRSKTIKKDAV